MKEPTPAIQRLWHARIIAELKKGTAPEQTTAILNEMMECWQAVEDNAINAADEPSRKLRKR